MYKKLQDRIDEIKNDFKIGVLKECERKLEELNRDIYLAGYLITYHCGTTVVKGGDSYLDYQEEISKMELEYEINTLEQNIKNGSLPVDYDVSGEKVKEVILINAREKKLTKEKLSEILNLIEELENNILLKMDKKYRDISKSFYKKISNEILQEYK